MTFEEEFVNWYNSYQYGSKAIIRKVNNLPNDYPLPEKVLNYEEWVKLKEDFPDDRKNIQIKPVQRKEH